MSTDLTKAGDTDLMSAFGNVGFGEFSQEIKFPYLSIAAKNSDAIVEGSDTYIEGLKAGYFFNSGNKRVYGKAVKVVILDYSTRYREFTVKDNGSQGDFVRIVPSGEIRTFSPQQLRDYTMYKMPSGNKLVEDKLYYVVLPEFKEDGIMMLSIGKGGFKHVRNWGAKIVGTGDPFPSHVWKIETGMMKNKDGQTWFTIGNDDTTFAADQGRVSAEMLPDIKEAFELVRSIRRSEDGEGTVALAAPAQRQAISAPAQRQAISAPAGDEEIPY